MTINLKHSIRLKAYGFRTADDCPGRDPRKWDVKFYFGNKVSYDLKNMETPYWPDRY